MSFLVLMLGWLLLRLSCSLRVRFLIDCCGWVRKLWVMCVMLMLIWW